MGLARCDIRRQDGSPCGRIVSTTFPMHECRGAVPAKRERKPRPKRMGYREAIDWVAQNDDTDFLNDGEDACPSVTMAFLADVYGVSQEKAER